MSQMLHDFVHRFPSFKGISIYWTDGANSEKPCKNPIDAIKSEAENMKELIEQLLSSLEYDNEHLP